LACPLPLPDGGQFGDAVHRLLNRHLLQQRHQVDRGLRRFQHPHHGLRLVVYRADPGQARHLVVDVEETGDPAGRRRVEHHRVVHRPARLVLAAHRLADLAGEQHVAQAGGDGGGEVDRAELLQRPAGPAELVEHVEVVEHRQLGVDRQCVHLAAARRGGDLPLLVRQRLGLEELGDALPLLDLTEQHAAALGREGERERGGDRGLSRAALARHDMEPDG